MRDIIILPTADIVREFEDYESVFCFYDEGLRGVIKDIVLYNTVTDTTGEQTSMLVQDVISVYEHSLYVRYLENTLSISQPEICIEMMVIQLESAVSKMLKALFVKELQRYRWDRSSYEWLGNDLITRIKLREQFQNSHFIGRLR